MVALIMVDNIHVLYGIIIVISVPKYMFVIILI